MVIISYVPISLHLLGSLDDNMLRFFFPLLLSPILSSHLPLPLSSSLPLSFPPPPAPKANVSFLSSSQIIFLIKEWRWQGWGCSRMWVLSDGGGKEGISNICILFTIRPVFHQRFHFSLKSFSYLKATDMKIYCEVKKIELLFAGYCQDSWRLKAPASPWVSQAMAFYVVLFSFFLSKHMLTGLVFSVWYGDDWKYTLCCLIKTFANGEQLCHVSIFPRGLEIWLSQV